MNQLNQRIIGGLVLWLCWVAWSSKLAASSPEAGVAYLRHFPPKEIQGGPQVLQVVRDPRGVMYFAANRSILIYDGVRWRHVRIGTPRRLAVATDGRIWVGCDGDLGYLETVDAEPRFVSLRSQLPEADRPAGQVVGTEIVDDGVFFVYARQVIRWSPTGIETQHFDGPEIEATAVKGGVLHLYWKEFGPAPWPSQPVAAEVAIPVDGRVHTLLPVDGGGFLIGTSSGRLYRWRLGEAESFSPEAERRLDGSPAWQLSRLEDGRVSVASRGAGLLLLTPDGRVETHFTEELGLPGREVYAVAEDAQGSLWLGLSPGIVRVSSSPVTFYDASGGGPKSILSLVRHQGDLYLGSVEGAYRLARSVGADPARFEPVTPLENNVVSWASTPHGLLTAGRGGIHQISGLTAERLSKEGQAILWDQESGVALASSDALLRVLVPESREAAESVSWRFIDHPDVFSERIYEIQAGKQAFWLITMGTRTLYRLTFPEGYEGKPSLTPFEMSAPWPRPFHLAGELRIIDRDRVLFYDESAADLFTDARFAIGDWRPPGVDRYELKSLANGEVWVGMRDRLVRLDQLPDGSYQPGNQILGLSAPLTFDMRADPEEPEVLWLSTELGPARVETDRLAPITAEPLIRFLAGEAAAPVVPYSTDALRFEVAVPFYLEESLNEYQFRLVGLSDSWSEWTHEPVKEYTNLPGHAYSFEVRARHAGRLLGKSSLDFSVLPPWYHTWWARGGYILALVGLALSYGRVQRRKLLRERAISERERAASQRLRTLDRLKDEFLANTSHELRTPLYGITGLAESLIDGVRGQLPEDARGDLSMLVASGRRLSALVDDILDFSRLKHHNLELRKRPVDLLSLVDVVLALTRPLVNAKRVDLVNAVDPELPPADGDENRLQQVLHNLVGNAIKFTEQGSIKIEAEVRGPELVVRVVDSGLGIPADRQSSIFEVFEQAHDATEFVGGTGLGLVVSRQLIALHGGSLRLESSSPEGTTFVFSLPISRLPYEASPVGREISGIRVLRDETDPMPTPDPIPTPEATPKPPFSSDMSRILVVDDEPVNRQVISNHLTSRSCGVIEARDGPEALRLLEVEVPDLILLDVMMPKMSGYEVCRNIRLGHSLQELPIIFLTAKNQMVDLTTGFSVGANDYLVKPVAKHELLARVGIHLELLHVHRHLERLVEERSAQIKILRGMLPICASCKKIRDDEGYWNEIESYISDHSEAEFSHGICPDCFDTFYTELNSPKKLAD